MNKKSFILIALVINITICITLCVGVFTEKDNRESGKMNNTGIPEVEKTEETTSAYVESDTSEETVKESPDITTENTSKQESQVETSETVPITYNLSIETTTPETTTQIVTTSPQETVVVNGTTAVVNSSCNIHSVADTGNNIGVANAGTTYPIDTTKCTPNWVAIILPDGSTGYVASSFCTIQ